MELHNQHPGIDYYKKRQEFLNETYSQRVYEWLKSFSIDTAGKVLHIIEGPPESSLSWREGEISTRTRFLGIGGRIRFSLGSQVAVVPSYKPDSKKTLLYQKEIQDGLKRLR